MKSLENAHKHFDGDEKVQKEILKLRDRLGNWVLGTKKGRVKLEGKDWKMEPMDALHLKRLMGRFGSAAEQDALVTGEAQNIANRLIRNPHAPSVGTPYTPSLAEDAMGMPVNALGIHDVMEEAMPGIGKINDRLHGLLEAEKG
jgi:hypothetical protein